MKNTVTVEIDDKKVEASAGATIIEAADQAGIYIPRFCYHKKLSVAANCRMCLVEVTKSGKPLPACATPIAEGMQIHTQSDMALAAQRAVMEFLLINHPLDCPICDQGGECELQDVSMGYGGGYSSYREAKRAVAKEDIGPLIDTGMTRCIHCTRCVRFGEEVAGLRELGATGRGEDMQIGTYVKHFLRSEISGNVIDLCPVGALTSKPYRYSARGWEMQAHAAVAPHDCLGSNVVLHTRATGTAADAPRQVMRVLPREAPHLNEMWLSDRDRFSYAALQHESRLLYPQIKRNGKWHVVTWQQILPEVVQRLQTITASESSAQAKSVSGDKNTLAGLIAPQASTEEMYLLQRILRHLGSDSIDYRVRQQDFSDQQHWPASLISEATASDLEQAHKIFLLGSNIRYEVPLLGLRVRMAALSENAGAAVVVLNQIDYDFTFATAAKLISSPQNWRAQLEALLQLLKASAEAPNAQSSGENSPAVTDAQQQLQQMAIELGKPGEGVIVLGLDALHHPQAAVLRHLAHKIAKLTGCKLMLLTDGANSAGAAWAGCVPHRHLQGEDVAQAGCDAREMFAKPHRAYWLHGIEPEYDSAVPQQALAALRQAELVICCHSYVSSAMRDYADILLPAAAWSEYAGSFINMFGDWQAFSAIGAPPNEVRPAWKILQAVGRLLGIADFTAQHASAVSEDLRLQWPTYKTTEQVHPWHASELPPLPSVDSKVKQLFRAAPWGIYNGDAMLRRASDLQQVDLNLPDVAINQVTADRLQLSAGQNVIVEQAGQSLTATLSIHASLADNVLCLPSGTDFSAGFGEAMTEIKLRGV